MPTFWPWVASMVCAALLVAFGQLTPRAAAVGWLIAALCSCVIAMVQYFGLSSALAPLIGQTEAGEAFGNLRQRNQFATLTSMGLVALIALRAARPDAALPRWFFAAAVILLAAGNAASGSRTGLLQWVAIALLCTWWWRLERRDVLVLVVQALLAYGVAILALPWLLEVISGQHSSGLFGRLVDDAGCSSRRVLYANVIELIAQKPWFGWGWGELDYAHFIQPYRGPRFCEILDNAHNLPLHLAVELGLPAALAVCAGFAWAALKAAPWHEEDPYRRMAWGVIAVILVHSMLEYPLWYGPFQIAFVLCAWIVWRRRKAVGASVPEFGESRKSGESRAKAKGAHWRLPLAAASVLALAYAGADYRRVSQLYLPLEQRSPAYRNDTLDKVRDSVLFESQVEFAVFTTTAVRPDNAASMHALGLRLLHFSPEPRVVEKIIQSAELLGRNKDASFFRARYRAVFPREFAAWASGPAAGKALP